jgi:hypothetical protein
MRVPMVLGAGWEDVVDPSRTERAPDEQHADAGAEEPARGAMAASPTPAVAGRCGTGRRREKRLLVHDSRLKWVVVMSGRPFGSSR